uniref:Uncharacterized protein n=1 Tax=Buteo japonicus TaxID=224669 RepID=A0A8B9Z5N0_9AVES
MGGWGTHPEKIYCKLLKTAIRYENSMGSSKNVISEPVDVEEGYNMMASFQRSNSHDKVRKIVAEEGRTARNLIAWSVPLENKEDDGMYSAVFHQLFPLLSLCPLELLTWKHVSYIGFLY